MSWRSFKVTRHQIVCSLCLHVRLWSQESTRTKVRRRQVDSCSRASKDDCLSLPTLRESSRWIPTSIPFILFTEYFIIKYSSSCGLLHMSHFVVFQLFYIVTYIHTSSAVRSKYCSCGVSMSVWGTNYRKLMLLEQNICYDELLEVNKFWQPLTSRAILVFHPDTPCMREINSSHSKCCEGRVSFSPGCMQHGN